MSERRVSTRILSVVLVLCMVFGMVPAGAVTAFAADSTTATAKTGVTAIREYAAKLLKDNFSKTGSAPDWDTEGKSDTWRYYNGVMLDALLMLGVDSDTDGTVSTNSALEYAKDYMDANIESDGTITNWHAKELDSVPPALTLFALLDTAEVDEATRADYVTAINYVYKQLENQTAYDNCGGNYLHKDSWTEWNIGLDGIYMAQPFLMEYANALAAKKITNTVNSKTAETIQKEVYDRLIWVSEKMYDEDTGLYHHGWNVKDDKGNGHFWSRGIGWYAAGLVMCMDLMPATYQDGLKSALTTLFDGMLKYQVDATGLWYNVVNRDSTLTSNNGNKLETSGTALMAYAMMKAVNEGWVDSKYATSALEAFNGIVANKLKDGKITDIYKSSGVCTNDGDYCKNDYKSDEAKGVGPVLMAAAEVDKYLGTAETFKAGVVVAPDITVALNGTPNYSGVKITVLGSQGTIKDIPYNDAAVSFVEKSTLAVGDTAGTIEVAVVYDESVIGTFNVNVVDSSVPATGEGTLGIESESTETPTAPSVTAGNWVEISAGGSGDGTKYKVVNTVTTTDKYLIAKNADYAIGVNTSGSNRDMMPRVDIDAGGTTLGTEYSVTGTLVHYQFEATATTGQYRIYTDVSGTKYYIQLTGNSDSKQICLIKESDVTDTTTGLAFTVNPKSESESQVALSSVTYSGREIYIDSNGANNKSASQYVYLYELVPSGTAKYALLNGTATYAYPVNTETDILAAIQADYKIQTSTSSDGTNPSDVAWTDSTVSYTWDTDLDVTKEETYTLTVKVDGKAIGTIPVLIYGNTVTTEYDIAVSVTPGAIVATEGDTDKPQFNATVTIEGLSGYGSNVVYSGGADSVATVSSTGLVTIVGKGTTTIIATVDFITYDGKTYTADDFGTVTVEIPVTVNAKADDTHTHSYNGAETQAPTCTQAGVMTYTCSCGNSYTSTIPATGHSYVNGSCSVCGAADPDYVAPGIESISAPGNTTGKATITAGNTLQLTANTVGGATVAWSSGDEEIAEVSDTGLVTGKAPGTATITATVTNAVTKASNSATFEVTVTEAVTVDGNVSTTETTGGTGTSYGGYIDSSLPATDFFTFSSVGYKSGVSMTYDGVTTDGTLKMQSSTSITFDSTSVGAGTLLMVFDSSSAAKSIKIDGTTYTLSETDGLCVLSVPLSAGAHTVARNSGESYLGYISYTTAGTSGGTTETKYNATLTVAPSSLSMTVGGDTVTLAPSVSAVLAADNTTAVTVDQSSYTVTWTPNNTDVVTVDSEGKVTAVGAGETTITGAIAKDSAMKVNNVDGTVLEDITVTVPVTVAAAAHSHTYTSEQTKAPTCTEKGTMTYTCSCGNSYTEEIAATGHTEADAVQENVKNATCVAAGSYDSVVYCSVCNTKLSTETVTVPATGEHTYENGACSVCGATDPDNESGETGNVNPPVVDIDTIYEKLTILNADVTYVVIARNGSNRTATHGTDPGVQEAAWTAVDGGWKYGAVAHIWVVEKIENSNNYYIYYMDGTTKYYLNGDGTNNLVCSATADTQWTITFSDDTAQVTVASGSHGNDDKRIYLNVDGSNGPKFESSAQTLVLYAPVVSIPNYTVTAIPEKESMLTGTTQTITASMLLGTEAVDGATYVWSITSGDATISGEGATATLTAGSNDGDVVISVTATSGDNTATGTATVKVTAPVTVTSAALNKTTLEVANGDAIDTSSVKIVLTMSDGTTVELSGDDLTFTNLPTDTTTAGTTTAKVSATYNETAYEFDLSVVVAAAATGNGDWVHNFTTDGLTNEFYSFHSLDLQDLSSSVSYDGLTLTKGGYLGSSGDYIEFIAPADGTFTLVENLGGKKFYTYVDGVKGTTISTDSDGVYTMTVETGKTYKFEKNNQTHLVYLEYVPEGEITAYPKSATVSPDTVNVANSGTIDMSGVTMEVTMSDGSKKTIANADLTYDTSFINTALTGSYSVPVSYTENGKTVTANVNVVVAAASAGGTTSDLWKHNFSEDGKTDADGFFTIKKGSGDANLTTSYDGSYGNLEFDTALKMESDTTVSFTAPSEGTLTLVFNSGSNSKDVKINGTSYTIGSDGTLTVEVEAGDVTISKDDSTYLFYMEYASSLVDGITLTAPNTMYIAAAGGSLNPTHEMQYVVRHNDTTLTEGFTIEWTTLDTNVATINENGVLTAVNPGTTSITAKLTITADGTVYDAVPVLVTVVGPGVSSTEEITLIKGEASLESQKIASTVYAGGVTVKDNFALGYKSSDETVATVSEDGTVTAVAPGTATIYTYIKSVNGITVYDGDGIDPQPAYFDATAVTVSNKELVNASLNSYDYVVYKNQWTALLDALSFKENVSGNVVDDSGVSLTLEYNTGSTEVIEFHEVYNEGNQVYESNGLRIDLSGVDMTTPDIYTAPITYTDDQNNVIFRDTLWIHVLNFDPDQFDGTLTKEDGTHYILHTGAFTEEDANNEYVIVAENADFAFKNPSESNLGSTTAATAPVIKGFGQVKSEIYDTYLYDGQEVNYLTISDSDSALSEWLLDTLVDTDPTDNVVQLNMSNFNRYIGGGSTQTQLIHNNVSSVELVTLDETTGESQIILGYGRYNQPYYLGYVDGIWTATTEECSVFLYYKDIEFVQDYGINFDLYDKDYDLSKLPIEQECTNFSEMADGAYKNVLEIPDGFVYESVTPVIVWNEDNVIDPSKGHTYTIEWSSSNTNVATVDQNGVITAIDQGEAIITATLYDINGNIVICNTHNTEHISTTMKVEVTSSTPVPVLTPDELTIGVGTMPNFNKVAVRMTFGESGSAYDYDVPFDQLVFKLADATGTATDGTAMSGFDNTVTGTYEVPVTYAGDTFTLTVHVVEDPYAGLEEAESIPGYPDAGSVRMQKFANGVLDFTSTGVTKIELNAAGISTKSSVDVVLIVDVSNSMGWSMTWFDGMSASEVDDATDSVKIPSNGADGTDKLDIAMQTATEFADILLNVPGGDNTMTFVTFAGADRDHGGSSDNVDSVRTPMVAIGDYATAASVFADTKFTSLTKDGTGAKYTLQIGGYTGDGYGEAKVSGSNRGNTNYDYAFGEAMDAIDQIKAKYAANNNGASYDESGRQLHVVFMTDGAPSHYNDQRGNGSAKDTLWDGSGDTYTTLDDNSEANWLAFIKNYNELATQLLPLIDGAYTVGFDMAHGGFGDYSYDLDEMRRVLEGLAKNTIVPATLAENEQELDDYMTSLARALAYAGTNAKVTDQIGENFSLFTGVHMYSKDITDGIMTEDLYNQMAGMSFPITVYSYRLVVSTDIGKSLSVIKTDGTVETVTVDESHLGLRVNEDPEVLEQITFSADGTEAFSDVLGTDVNIMTINSKGERVIDAATFTYTATLDTMTVDGVEVTHAADEQIIWKIGNITDREVSMQYYAYLDGSLDNPREAVSGVYATNEYAYLEYVDVEGKYVKRDFGVPQIAWGKANVTVRFYLVNKDGQFVNRAGVTFTNPANRLFLTGRTQYEAELNNQVEFDAQAALVKAGLAATNVLFDPSVHVTVVNSTNPATTDDGVDFSNGTAKEKGLLFYNDTSNGFYSNVIVDIPVILTDLGESENKMFDKSVVIDYGKEIVFDPFDATYEGPYKSYTDANGLTMYEMNLVGFANYNADHDLKDYVPATGYVATLNTENGSYKVSDGKVSFTPTRMLSEVEKVFAVVYFKTYTRTSTSADWTHDISNDHYMYKLVSIIPATSVYYETDFATGVFTLNGSWTTRSSGAEKDGPQEFVEIGTDDCYGYDESYADDNGYSNYSSAFATGTALADGKYTTTAAFSFTGTGFDIISKTGAKDGAIVVTITQDGSDFRKKITVINKGENDLYQIPVISVEDLAYGTYNVEIGVAPAVTYPEALSQLNRGGDFYFDAVRIYNPAKGNTVAENTYVKDNEANTQLFEIRGLLVNPVDASIKVSGVSYIDKTNGEATLDDYASIGPNNELYINGNSAIAFAISWNGSAPTSIDIGAKSILSGQSANLKAYISGDSTQPVDAIRNVSVSSATAQFYELVNKSNAADFSAINTAYVFIENTGSGVLSLTDIKVAFGNAAATASIDFSVDQEVLDFANACATFGDVDEDPSTEETESAITQKGRTLGYEDLIYVIDIFELKGIEGIDLTKDAGLMIWTEEEFEALNGTLVFDEAHANVGLMPYEGEEGFYYGISDGIFTRDLHKKAYYAGYVKQADGSYIFSEAKLYSPAIYAYNMLEKAETSDNTRNLCVALLNYISAAQKYFHDAADADLVNANLTAEQKTMTWDAPELNLASEVPSDKNVARDSKVFTGAGKNLLFEEMISLVSVYKIDNAIVENAAECGTIFWTAEQFAALDGVPGVDNIGDGVKTVMFQYLSKDGQWASCAPAVAAKDMADTEYFILGYVIHEDGTVSYSGVMSYTFEQYINNMADSAAMGEFAMRLYYYERAAKAALG